LLLQLIITSIMAIKTECDSFWIRSVF